MRLTLTAPVAPVTASDPTAPRRVTGPALPYGAPGRTSIGDIVVDAGALTYPAALNRVKLFSEHGRTTPVGYAVALDDGPAELTMSFDLARTPAGDTALLEVAEHVRDALSVELDDVTMTDGHVTAARLVAVALTSVPAFADAWLAASDPGPNGDDEDDDEDVDEDEDNGADDGADTDPADAGERITTVPPTTNTVNVTAARVPAERRRRAPAGRPLSLVAADLARVVRGSTDAAQINAALSDIVPGDDTSTGAFIRPQWIDEVWTPAAQSRDFINALGAPQNLTGMTLAGWKWETRPQVAPYAGNKAPIPSNKVKIVPATGTAYRLAGGWDIDRIFVDLGDPGFIEALFRGAAVDLALKQEEAVAAALIDEAFAVPENPDGIVDGLSLVARYLGMVGAVPSFIGMSADLWSEWINMSTADAPWWLSSGTALSIKDSNGAAADLRVFANHALPGGTILGGDTRAATYYEPRGNPFRVQAVNIPNGGIDIALFSYQGVMVNDSTGVVAVTVGGTTPPAQTNGNGGNGGK